MSGKKWLMIGCGGCLGVVVLFIIAIVSVGWYFGSYIQELGQAQEELLAEHNTLEQAFPFTPPEDESEAFSEDRFKEFLAVRSHTISEARTQLEWFLENFALQEGSNPDINWTEAIWKFMDLPKDVMDIGMAQIEQLKTQEMSTTEYTWYTRVMAAEIASWQDLPEDNPLHQTAIQYLQPLDRAKEIAANIENQNAQQNIDLDIFQKERYLSLLENYENPNHPHRELFSQYTDEILADNLAVFIDCWAANNFEYEAPQEF